MVDIEDFSKLKHAAHGWKVVEGAKPRHVCLNPLAIRYEPEDDEFVRLMNSLPCNDEASFEKDLREKVFSVTHKNNPVEVVSTHVNLCFRHCFLI